MDGLGHLLASYTAVIVINLALAVATWWRQRERLSLTLIAVWSAGAVSLVCQGLLIDGAFQLTLGFSSTFFTNLAVAFLLAQLTGLRIPWRAYLAGLCAALCMSFVASRLEQPFWLVALPTSMAVSLPLAQTSVRALRQGEVTLTTTGKAFIIVGWAFILHTLDFPFMRPHPELAAIGFTLAMIIVFPMSVTALAVVLERVAGERARLAELEELKSRFFANISHELRTPLTLILSPLQAVADEPASEPFRGQLQLAQRSAERLLRLVDDILDLSKLEAGALELRVTSVDLAALVERAVAQHQPAFEQRRQSLTLKVAGLPPPPILGDAHRLEMVLTNLIGNANKYVQDGGHVEVRLGSDGQDVVLEVSDDGPGIAAERQAQIFDRFVQGAGAKAGVGIGLSLARELAELHGGSLNLRSAQGQGTTFSLRLPVRAAGKEASAEPVDNTHAEAARASAPLTYPAQFPELDPDAGAAPEHHAPILLEGGRRARILVAEDDPDLRAFIGSVLDEEGEVVTAADGREALRSLDEARPDLLLTDVMMPHMTGKELCRAIKQDVRTRDLPVLMLTARAGVEAAIEGFDAGADYVVAKPFHPRVLRARVRSHLMVRQLALQLADQARLASAGSLAAGVAHEVRNPLNAVSNAAEVLAQMDSGPGAELLGLIVDGAKRISSVIDALDVHARPADGLESRPCDVREGAVSTMRLLRHQAGSVQLHVDGAEGLEVCVPARAFHQALTNLVDNAIKAARTEVRVQLEASAEHVDIAVLDDGEGVPDELMQRIFDPFFTTRDVGAGRGLGLYVSRSLARECGGELWVERGPQGGARFVLRLPRVQSSKLPQSSGPRPMETLSS